MSGRNGERINDYRATLAFCEMAFSAYLAGVPVRFASRRAARVFWDTLAEADQLVDQAKRLLDDRAWCLAGATISHTRGKRGRKGRAARVVDVPPWESAGDPEGEPGRGKPGS